jgi:hypothetical protein
MFLDLFEKACVPPPLLCSICLNLFMLVVNASNAEPSFSGAELDSRSDERSELEALVGGKVI